MKNPVVTIEMMNGDTIKAELYPEIAPNTVNNFISLVKKGFYANAGLSANSSGLNQSLSLPVKVSGIAAIVGAAPNKDPIEFIP